MINETGKIIHRQKFNNGMELLLYDRSRFMAGDRWLVELYCEACTPIDDSCWRVVADEEPRLLHAVREMLGEKLVFVGSRKRNFVHADEREAILLEMVQQLLGSTVEYLQRPAFPLRLFRKLYQDARRKVLIQQAMSRVEKL